MSSDNCSQGCAFSSTPPTDVDLQNLPQTLCRVIQDLKLLVDVSRELQQGMELKEIILPILRQMHEALATYRCAVHVLNRSTGTIDADYYHGLPLGDIAQGLCDFDKIQISTVIQTGRSSLISDIYSPSLTEGVELKSPAKQDKASSTGMVCVPISLSSEVMGALSFYKRYHKGTALDADARIMTLIAQLIAQAVKMRQNTLDNMESLRKENQRLMEAIQKSFRPDNMIGNSRSMQMVYHHVDQVAMSNTTVLIRGESGVGKELVAHAIHRQSQRGKKSFVKVNCAALPESIVESELFGHEKGAFTGAISMRKGRFELAHEGTLFLDEIGELPLPVQAKLLRVLQEREFERVGGTETLRCDVRVIAATNRALEDFMSQQKFRLDLYYRLNVFPIYVPPLRERKSDILLLSDFFVEKYNASTGKQVKRFSTPAIDMLMAYHWPGNVRELENCIERAVLLSTDGVIHGYHLPPTLQTAEATSTQGTQRTLQESLDAFEREQIIEALKESRGKMAAAARQLGLTERIMGLRVKKYSLNPETYMGN